MLEVALSGSAGTVEVLLADDLDTEELRVTVDLGGPLEVTVTGPGGGRRTHRIETPPSPGDTLTVYRDGSLVEIFHAGRAATTRWYGATAGSPVLRVLTRSPANCRATLSGRYASKRG